MKITDGRYQIESEDADLSHSKFTRVTLKNSTIRNADLSNLVIDDVKLKDSTWNNVNLSALKITDANLSHASIASSCYEGMTIEGIHVIDMLKAWRAAHPSTD